MRLKARQAIVLVADVADLIAGFLVSQLAPEGGFRNRAGVADLYYTPFGIEAMLAIGADLPRDALRSYLASFGGGEELDLVHASCLARSWASLAGEGLCDQDRQGLIHRLLAHRSADRAFAAEPGQQRGSVYATFLALGSGQDLQVTPPQLQAIVPGLQDLRREDGSWANEPGARAGTAPVTAAAVVLVEALQQSVDQAAIRWLLGCHHPQGGFLAHPSAPLSDLLSTATALHALATADVDLGPFREDCLDFVDRLWSSRGSFRATESDPVLDCEYCWYGLLALGHLAGRAEDENGQ